MQSQQRIEEMRDAFTGLDHPVHRAVHETLLWVLDLSEDLLGPIEAEFENVEEDKVTAARRAIGVAENLSTLLTEGGQQ